MSQELVKQGESLDRVKFEVGKLYRIFNDSSTQVLEYNSAKVLASELVRCKGKETIELPVLGGGIEEVVIFDFEVAKGPNDGTIFKLMDGFLTPCLRIVPIY